ncbi:hypothetical protein BOTBODRAFT_119805 [Botryobasidium botryosum FD-172 SS1]|uniref:Tc1-like transposase DDE domain-containing protein n=1 Tax=Botryobasidium botryosum (strain FD-172 SS1) TaxID=930990 RepID=A0A067M7Q6_BOTB1|nr:hypothetical protein BOTBODRAFT_119805 [Botryobasidium botryosum FD-172 SS1]
MAASLRAAHAYEAGPWLASRLRRWARDFILDRSKLPLSTYGKGSRSLLADEEFRQELFLHLQEVGKYVCAQDVVNYVARDDVKEWLGLTQGITLATAQRWMKVLGYRWGRTPTGQYVDGHERDDVVKYRQEVFLPVFAELLTQTQVYSPEGLECLGPHSSSQHTVIWHHDESIFYAHNRQTLRWVHKSETAVPHPKGEGPSLMVADFVSADYGWLRSPDGTEHARVLLKPGKNRDGYFTNNDILKQVARAMDILQRYYPNERHVFVFDNATTHLKRADSAISARHMPKNMPKNGREWDGKDWGGGRKPKNWGVEVNVVGADGKPVYKPDGSLLKQKVKMGKGKLADDTPQSFYYPDGHEFAGVFKGMAVILEERGYADTKKLRAECPGFKCPSVRANPCCCRRLLYNEPDFVNVKSLLETACEKRGFLVLFVPKFHCELNFIELCWGYSKRIYQEFPMLSAEEDLEKNVLKALEAIPIETIRRFTTKSHRFMDTYRKGLNGKQAAWASRKYRGHRVLPESIFRDLEDAKLN